MSGVKWQIRENQNESSELTHYGILGMKWGVRRTPEQLGHVKKGTKMYRVSPYKDEVEKGSTYVTYLPPDRDMYRGSFAYGIRKYYKLNFDDPLYEAVYKAKMDLKMPPIEEQRKVVNEVVKRNDNELLKPALKRLAEEEMEQYKEFSHMVRRNYKFVGEKQLSEKELRELFWPEGKKNAKQMLDEFGQFDEDTFYRVLTSRFGKERVIKEAVITELKSRGYNAMVDQAGVGGKDRPIEGFSPIIVFDRNEVLEKKKSKQISRRTEDKAEERYYKWKVLANLDQDRVKNW